jgi:MFS family permease
VRDSSAPSGSPEPPEAPDPTPAGRLAPLGPGPMVAAFVLGLVGGWLWHPVAERVNGTAPMVGWTQGAVLFFVTAILGALALVTWRTVHVHRERLEARQAVNRLVLARACMLVGALVAGWYVGYTVSWVGSSAELAEERMVRSLVAAAGATGVLITGKLLERACRVPKSDPHP